MGWLLAGILLVFWLGARQRLKAMRESASWQDVSETSLHLGLSAREAHRQICDLSILRLELAHLRAADTLSKARHAELTERIDTALAAIIQQSWGDPGGDAWVERRDAAWMRLMQDAATTLAPPWRETADTVGVETPAAVSPMPLYEEMAQPVAIPSLSMTARAALSHAAPAPTRPPQAPEPPSHGEDAAEVETPSDYALEPKPPSAIERALQAVSGWPALLIPFMAQNIGWFIGGLCFVAGSVFLVSYTTGFAKSLTIFSVLFAYTLLVLWAGYKLRRRRPELIASSSVLLTIGVLLTPLNVAAAVRLIATGMPAAGAAALGCLAAALCLGGLYYAIALASGLVDRALQGRHPQLFIALAAMQLAVPLLAIRPSWPVLALLHLALLGLLTYGLARFLPHWLHAIFVERRNTAYYAAGTLVYAALVSFIHLTWGYKGPLALPAGYYGPFLMLLSGVLFYVDAQLKQWAKRDTFLSRLSFAIYGVSILALFAGVGPPATQALTLILGIALYASVMWRYVTLPSLYALLVCSAWLYHTVILSNLPFAWYFLASAPGLAALWVGSWRALRLQSPVITQMSCRIWALAILGLAAWSLVFGQPGWVAITTALVVMALAFLGPRYMPAAMFDSLSLRRGDGSPGQGHRNVWGYTGMLAAVVAMAYAPPWLGLAWSTQLAFGLLALAETWTLLGARRLQPGRQPHQDAAEVWLNGALLTLLLGVMAIVGLGGLDLASNRALPLALAFAAGALLQLSLSLGSQWLCYGALLFAGAAGVVVKLTYFPVSGSGSTSLSVALATWALLWWIERKPLEVIALLREHAELRTQTAPPPRLLWCCPTSFRPYPDIVGRPLQHAILLLGVVGLLQVIRHILTEGLDWSGVASTILATTLALLIAGRHRWTWLLPLAVGLGLGSALSAAYSMGITTIAGLSFVGACYAIGVWRIGLLLLRHPLVIHACRFLRLRGERQTLEPAFYGAAFAITILSLLAPLVRHGLFTPHLALLCSLIAGMAFFWLSAQRYRRYLHVYLCLGTGAFSVLLVYLWRFYHGATLAMHWPALAIDPGIGLTLTLVGLGLWAVTRVDASNRAALTIYLTPLRVMAIALALIAAVQQVSVAWLAAFMQVDAAQNLAILALGLSSLTLLLANHGLDKPGLSTAGIFGGALTAFWAQGLILHGSAACSIGLLTPSCADQWFTLALIASGAACLARYLDREPRWEQLYIRPLRLAAAATYAWALLAATLSFTAALPQSTASLPWLFLTLSVAFIPIVDHWPKPAAMRGVGAGLLLTASVVSALAIGGWRTLDGFILTGWAFALWELANVALPRYNARWPQWRIAPDAWPWFGLGILALLLATWWRHMPQEPWHTPLVFGAYLTACALYLFMMLRHSGWAGMSWLAAFALLGAGASSNLAWAQLRGPSSAVVFLCIGLGYLAWLNLMLRGVSGWRRHGPAIATRLAWRDHDLSRPLLAAALTGLGIAILAFVLLEALSILWTGLARELPWAAVSVIGAVMTFSCIHRLVLRRDAPAAHATIAAAYCTLLAVWLGLAMQVNSRAWGVHLPLFLALWCAVLLGVAIEWRRPRRAIAELDFIRQRLSPWLMLSAPATIASLIPFPQASTVEALFILAAFGAASAYLGHQRRQAAWLFIAMSALVASLHAVWCFWAPLYELPRFISGYAVQLAALMWLAGWLRNRVERPELGRALQAQQWLLGALALSAWLWHSGQALMPLMSHTDLAWRMGPGGMLMAVAAPLVLIAFGIAQARRTQQAAWVYGVAALSGALGLYVRLLWLGLAPMQVWDTAALIGAAYALFALQRLTQSQPILRLVMILPLLALATIPFQLNSPHASGALLTIGVLYLGMRRATNRALPLYLGVTALNIGVYLWAPSWAHRYQLGQLYIIPAALSMLWLLHVHRRDVRPAVLHSVRLATISILYASAASDVFLRPSLTVFMAALGLSLMGVAVGTALRVRAFLYAGTAFFIINIAGQLLLLFPEQRLGKAVVLLALGTSITGAMIWFNAQREAVLQRIRVFRSDLAEWE